MDHAVEDEAVEGEDGVPVEAAVDAQGAEGGGLGEAVLVIDFEFQPGFARQFHFGVEEQAFFFFLGQNHPPKVQGFAR